ncbi:MAG: glutathione peroxidase [Pseudomonadota bacterium]
MNKANAYQFSFETIDGKELALLDLKGKPFLVVNTASLCGFTSQYEGLEKLYQTYKEQGFKIIAVPCNDFGNQEPKSEIEIKDFVKNTYGVTFPVMKKYSTKGSDAHPFFTWAASQKQGGMIFSKPRWNFHKFLIDQNGNVANSFGSQVEPMSKKITQAIENLLAENNG